MRNKTKLILVFLSLLPLKAMAADTSSVVKLPLVIGTRIETGQLVDGVPGATANAADPSAMLISQIGVSLTQEVIVDQRLDMKVGVGGVFYYSFPVALGNANGLGTKFGPGIGQAQAAYKLGDVSNPWGTLRVGYFPFKYDPDAKNLGEYLFRSGAYPTYVFTGGWAITDNAFVKLQGIDASFSSFNGAWKNDFLLTAERDNRPTGDISLTYLTQVTVGAFQFGGGAELYHYLPIKPSQVTPQGSPLNTYYEYDTLPGFTAVRSGDTIHVAANQHLVVNGGDVNNNLYADSNSAAVTAALATSNATPHYYTFKALKLAARASFNVQKLVKLDFLQPDELKIYSEVAVLGWKDYPGLYSDRWNRMPVMVGINLPTFRLLDVLSFEVEYMKNSNPDDLEQMQLNQLPNYSSNIQGSENGDASLLFRDPNANTRDDWKWSVYAKKQLIRGFSLVAQVANDHFRPIDTQNAGLWEGNPLLATPKNWYYVLSINFGI